MKELVPEHVDNLVLTETKLDDSFPNLQFSVDGFSEPFRIDRNRSGGEVMIFVGDDIPSKLLTKHFFPNDIEGLFLELNLENLYVYTAFVRDMSSTFSIRPVLF